MRVTVNEDPVAAARVAADELARACRSAVAARGRALVAVSGGETPWLMLRDFALMDLPWSAIHVAQVDERCAPHGDSRRNLTRLEQILVHDGPLPAANLHAMPVEATDLAQAALDYAATLTAVCGAPLRVDLVQLGLGTDGHTASLVPGDAVLAVSDRDVAVTGVYQGLRRMTLTLRALSQANERLWLVTGAAKVQRLEELLAGAGDSPAVRVARHATTIVADRAALPSGHARGSGESAPA